MKFSIVTSFYNESEKLIEECCKGVLSQTYSNFEWIVTDDFSQNEKTTNLVKSLPERDKRIRYVEQTKKKEIVWNHQTYAMGDVVVALDGDDHMLSKSLDVLHYFYTKYPDVFCITTEIQNYNENKQYIGSLYLDYQNYTSIFNYIMDIKHDPNIPRRGRNSLFSLGYNRSWRNINNIEFGKDLDKRLIVFDYVQLTQLEEMGKFLHIPRALYGYNTRQDSISRKLDENNSFHLSTKELDNSIIERRKGKNINSIKRIFDQIFIESNAFLNCGINFEIKSKKISLITPNILSPLKQEQIKELYFDHDIYFNTHDENIDYYIIQFNSPDQYNSLMQIYDNIRNYIGRKEIMIQITYDKIDGVSENNLMNKCLEFLSGRHPIAWFDFDNHYITIKIG